LLRVLDDHLTQAFAIAQHEKAHLAELPKTMQPAGQLNLLASMRCQLRRPDPRHLDTSAHICPRDADEGRVRGATAFRCA